MGVTSLCNDHHAHALTAPKGEELQDMEALDGYMLQMNRDALWNERTAWKITQKCSFKTTLPSLLLQEKKKEGIKFNA